MHYGEVGVKRGKRPERTSSEWNKTIQDKKRLIPHIAHLPLPQENSAYAPTLSPQTSCRSWSLTPTAARRVWATVY